MTEIISALFLFLGSLLAFIGAIGVIRFPGVLSRMHAMTKAASLGMGSILIGVCVHFKDPFVIGKSMLIMAFIFLTLPIGSHMIGRVSYLSGEVCKEDMVVDELGICVENQDNDD